MPKIPQIPFAFEFKYNQLNGNSVGFGNIYIFPKLTELQFSGPQICRITIRPSTLKRKRKRNLCYSECTSLRRVVAKKKCYVRITPNRLLVLSLNFIIVSDTTATNTGLLPCTDPSIIRQTQSINYLVLMHQTIQAMHLSVQFETANECRSNFCFPI